MTNASNGADTTGKDQPRADLRIEDEEAERIADRLQEIDDTRNREGEAGNDPKQPATGAGDGDAARAARERELTEAIELPVKGSA